MRYDCCDVDAELEERVAVAVVVAVAAGVVTPRRSERSGAVSLQCRSCDRATVEVMVVGDTAAAAVQHVTHSQPQHVAYQ